jgi:two-component sensor histidine kinase
MPSLMSCFDKEAEMLIEHAAMAPFSSPDPDLVAEANHRIANSLSAVAGLVQQEITGLKNVHREMHTSEVRQLLAEVRARIDAVARLHRALSNMPREEAAIDIGQYLQQLAAELVATLSVKGSVELHFGCELNCRTAPEKALYIGLMVVEVITNSIKYAHPARVKGAIEMRCWRVPNGLVIQISDDGVGFPDGFDPNQSHSKGIGIVRSLANQIDGKVTYRGGDFGVTCIIEAPALHLV